MSIIIGRLTSLPFRQRCAASQRQVPAWQTSLGGTGEELKLVLIGNDPTEQHPLLAWQIRNNVRLHRAKLYLVNSEPIKLRRQATNFIQIPAGAESKVASFLSGDDAAADALA